MIQIARGVGTQRRRMCITPIGSNSLFDMNIPFCASRLSLELDFVGNFYFAS